MADGELDVELVPDESALEDIEEKQVEIAGEGAAVDEARGLNESRNEKLNVANRKLGRIASSTSILAAIAAALASIAKTVGEVFGISFEDVRNAIVEVLNKLQEKFSNFITGIGSNVLARNSPFSERQVDKARGAILGSVMGPTGALAGALSVGGENENSNSQNTNVNFVLSRRSLLGDSTQQEMESENVENFVLNGGS